MPRIPEPILELARVHHDQLRSLEIGARRRVREELARALRRIERDREFRRYSDFEALQASEIEILAKLTARETSGGLEAALEEIVSEGLLLAPNHAEAELLRWIEYHGAEARPLNLAALSELSRTSLIEQIPRSLERWGPDIARRVRRELSASVTTRQFGGNVVDTLSNVIGAERWKADRIFRTELFNGYNAAHLQGLETARDVYQLPVKKSAIVTFDGRTDPDSYPMQGQVRELEENFVDGDGRRFLHPPGRPNDREKEIPWINDGEDLDLISVEDGIEQVEAERARNARLAGQTRAPAPSRLPVNTFAGKRQRAILSWTNGSNSNRAIAMKAAALEEFGLEGMIWNPRGRTVPDDLVQMRATLRKTYEDTQQFYSGARAGSVKLYRGVKTDTVVEGTIEAWTDDLEVARKFAGRGGKVIEAEIDTRRILASVDGPGWVNGRYGDQREFLILSDPPALEFRRGTFPSGPFSATDLDPDAIRAGQWGILEDSAGRARLEHLPSGRTLLEGAEFEVGELREIAQNLDRSGMFDGRGLTELGRESLDDTLSVYRTRFGGFPSDDVPGVDGFDFLGEQLGRLNVDLDTGAATTWSRRQSIEFLEDAADGYNIRTGRGVVRGNFGIITDEDGMGAGTFRLVHLPSGKQIHEGTRTYYSTGFRVPVDLGGFKQSHFKELADRFENYFDEAGNIVENRAEEFERLFDFFNNDDPFSNPTIRIRRDDDIEGWFREALGDTEDDFDPFAAAMERRINRRTVGPSPGSAARVRESLSDRNVPELSPTERFEKDVESRVGALRRGAYNRFDDPDYDKAIQEEAKRRIDEQTRRRLEAAANREEIGFEVGDGRVEENAFIQRRRLENNAPEYDGDDSPADVKRKKLEAERASDEAAEARKAERERRDEELRAELKKDELEREHEEALRKARELEDERRRVMESAQAEAVEEARFREVWDEALREKRFRDDYEAAILEEKARREAAEFQAMMEDAIARNEAFDKFTGELESLYRPHPEERVARWSKSSISADLPGDFEDYAALKKYQIARAGRDSNATLAEIADYHRARELETAKKMGLRKVTDGKNSNNYIYAERAILEHGGELEKNGRFIQEALAEAETWEDAKKVLADFGAGSKQVTMRTVGGSQTVVDPFEDISWKARRAPMGHGEQESVEAWWENVQRPIYQTYKEEVADVRREARQLAEATKAIPELHKYHEGYEKASRSYGYGSLFSERGMPGDHWGSADSGNAYAKGVAFSTGNKYRPIDKSFEVLEEQINLSDAIEAEQRYRYAQREIAKIPKKNDAFRGMAIPRDMVDALKDGSTKELTMTGSTALSFQRDVAEHYLSSNWTKDIAGEDSLPVLMVVRRSELFDRNVGMLHPSKSEPLPYEILNGLPKFRIDKVSVKNVNGVKVTVVEGEMIDE